MDRKHRKPKGKGKRKQRAVVSGVEPIRKYGIVGTFLETGKKESMIPDALVGWTRNTSSIPLNNVGVNTCNSQIRVTTLQTGSSGIDKDGSTTTVNLSGVVKQLYLAYRVVAFECKVTLQNEDAVGVQCWVGLSAALLAKNAASNPNFVLNKGFKEVFLPPANSSTAPTNPRTCKTFTVRGKLETFNGSMQCYVDDAYQALTGGTSAASTPSNNVYLHVGAVGVGANFTNGIEVTCVWQQKVVFFERDPQVS